MHLTLLLIFGIFLRNNFTTESRKVTPDGTVYEGFKVDAFRRITSHLIETNIVNKLGFCALNCVKNLECVSFNFGDAVNGKHVCELLRTDKYNSRSSYVTSTDYHYFYPGNKCMDPSPCKNNGSCYPDYDRNDYNCVCHAGTTGRNCEKVYSECSEIRQAGLNTSGVFVIDPEGKGSFPVYCDMTADGSGWIVFQKRFDGSVDFNRGWQDYKTGFGNLNGEFWLGNEKIHRLTKRKRRILRVVLEDWNNNFGYAMYSSFAISNEDDSYRLNVSGYTGTLGDSFSTAVEPRHIHNNMKFSAIDKDTSGNNCSFYYEGGWWFNDCYLSHLNGKYVVNDSVNSNYKAMCWWSFKSDYRSLKSTQMKLI